MITKKSKYTLQKLLFSDRAQCTMGKHTVFYGHWNNCYGSKWSSPGVLSLCHLVVLGGNWTAGLVLNDLQMTEGVKCCSCAASPTHICIWNTCRKDCWKYSFQPVWILFLSFFISSYYQHPQNVLTVCINYIYIQHIYVYIDIQYICISCISHKINI